jgi:hypothetical protein
MQNSDNPIQTFRWPSDQDPIAQSLHSGKHCLFYDGAFDHSKITYIQKLQDLCNWANVGIKNYGCTNFLKEKNKVLTYNFFSLEIRRYFHVSGSSRPEFQPER